MHKNKKKKIAITTLSALLAFNVGCSSTQSKNNDISELIKQNKQEEKVEEYKPPVREFKKFKGKKSVTLGEDEIQKDLNEKNECKFTKKVKELISEIALLNLKITNQEEININEICNLRNVYTEVMLLSNQEMDNTFTNHKKNFFDLDKRRKEVENIENHYYNLSQDYDLEREMNCFSNGEIIPTMVRLMNYTEQVKKEHLNFEDFCNINDYIINLIDILKAANSEKQKTYLEKTIEKLERLLPPKFKKDDMRKREEDCNILFRLR